MSRPRRFSSATRIHDPNGRPTPPAPRFGPFQLPTIERARVAEWIAATGDCVIHAVTEVLRAEGKPAGCFCANCRTPDAALRAYGRVI